MGHLTLHRHGLIAGDLPLDAAADRLMQRRGPKLDLSLRLEQEVAFRMERYSRPPPALRVRHLEDAIPLRGVELDLATVVEGEDVPHLVNDLLRVGLEVQLLAVPERAENHGMLGVSLQEIHEDLVPGLGHEHDAAL